jgi:membrane-bound lytic murein transglycosylase D
VRTVRVILASLLPWISLQAAEEQVSPDEWVGSAQIWMQANLSDWMFDLAGVDRQTVDQSLDEVQQGLRSLAPPPAEPTLEDAYHVLDWLHEVDGTQPLAAWLRSFLESGQHTPHAETNPEPATAGAPTTADPQRLWRTVMSGRPVPERAENYLSEIKPIFQSENVPPELAWVAEVESAFDPHARSPVGAVGLFQLMPDTAKSLGLSTWLPDERRNATKNARAAARYLQYLNDRFGNWRLALAAYNAGPTRVSRLLAQTDTYSYEAIAPALPAETRDYVAKVEATLFVREGVELASLAKRDR